MAFTLPTLPYATDALEPHIDAETMKIHHGRHHNAYITNLNKALEAHADLQALTIEQLLADKAAKAPDLVIQIIIGKDEALTLKVQDQSTPVVMKNLVRSVKAAQAAPVKSIKPGAAAAAPTSTAVVISADKNVKYEAVVKVMDTLQRAGVQRVGLSVQLAN